MGIIKQINIKNRTYYFYNDTINNKDFNSSLIKLEKKSFENIAIYYVGYITKKDEYKINTMNPVYLLTGEIDGFIEEKEGNKYLNVAFTDSNSELLKKYAEIRVELKIKLKR